MTIKDLYHLAIKMAIKADPRPQKEIDLVLKETKDNYNQLSDEEKDYFDLDKLFNPYADSRFISGKPETKVKTILAGIDMETAELLLAKELERNGEKIDLVLGHHPAGRGLLRLGDVVSLQESVFSNLGVPINVSQKILAPRIAELERAIHPDNFLRESQAANLLGLNLMCLHTVCDNLVYTFLEKKICQKSFRTLGEILKALKKIPEYQKSSRFGNPPQIFVGNEKSSPGKIAATGMTGGTSGSEKIYEKLAQQGVGTVLTMHMSEKHRKEAEKHHINVIVCGHMASDSIGMNLLLDKLAAQKIKIIPCSGLIRSQRK